MIGYFQKGLAETDPFFPKVVFVCFCFFLIVFITAQKANSDNLSDFKNEQRTPTVSDRSLSLQLQLALISSAKTLSAKPVRIGQEWEPVGYSSAHANPFAHLTDVYFLIILEAGDP